MIYTLLVFTSIKKQHAQNVYNDKFLNDNNLALLVKDSLEKEGWIYQKNFPFFFKKTKTGKAPKSCSFSPNDSTIAVTLLSDSAVAVELFKTNNLEKFKTIITKHENAEKNKGYAEGTWKNNNEFWFTRMTTGDYFIWDKEKDKLSKFDSKGIWTKIIEFSPNKNVVAMSHWISNSVTIFDVNNKQLIKKIKTGKTPRGICWLNDSTFAVALFNKGDIEVFNSQSGEKIFNIKGYGGAARDVQYDSTNKLLYYSNMSLSKVFKYDWEQKKYIGSVRVDLKPNSIRLSDDYSYLFVSCRGPNNKEGYTKRSPRNGDIYILDTNKWEAIENWRAGNQPTGLDISSDKKYLVQSNFQDNNIILWLISL